MGKQVIFGPTFEEMLHPEKIDPAVRKKALETARRDPLDPINLFNITWKDGENRIYYFVIPPELSCVETPIVALYASSFPTGCHKVGAAYSVLIEKQLLGEVDIRKHTLVWPSTGNYGIGGCWVGCRMNFDSLVILPEMMSTERFDRIKEYGGRVIATPGCESNVKEIYDKCAELKRKDPERIRILNQFEVFGNYRFHYFVTGNTILELLAELKEKGIGKGRCSAFVSAMGSAGTIAAGDRLKQVSPDTLTVGLEPVQCPTLMLNGYGGHDIQGIGDKHVTWIHNVMNMDCMMAIDDMECKKGLYMMTEESGMEYMVQDLGMDEKKARMLSGIVGISGVCNLLGAMKTARYYKMKRDDVIVTIFTDAIDRYHSVMEDLEKQSGKPDREAFRMWHDGIFRKNRTDWVQEGTPENKARWHNLKYYTWVEQQGKSIEELNSQKGPAFWIREQEKITGIDRLLIKSR